MSSTASSTVSPSPPASPAIQHGTTLSLERLVQHFVSAKRALNSAQHVENANDLVHDTRRLIERSALATAKNAFAIGKINNQVDTLRAIYDNLDGSATVVDEEFTAVITRLDEANDRLQKTLESLKAIVVDPSLHQGNEEATAENVDSHKTLFDFVDESQYEDISSSVKVSIDAYRECKEGLDTSLQQLSSDISKVTGLVQSSARSDSPTVKPSIYDEPLLPISDAFHAMEEHAAEMATLLQSLVSHYDLCTSALKHTEGGREAARNAMIAITVDGDTPSGDVMDDSLFIPKHVDPISEEERDQMLEVLEGDANEVEEVVIDLRERGAEIESLHEQFVRRCNLAEAGNRNIRQAVALLHQIRETLPAYIDTMTAFRSTWDNIQTSIGNRMSEMVSYRAFYEEFLVGYKKLLREVDRRKAVEQQMRKLASKAQKDLDQLYKADKLARDEFIDQLAGFLPRDLWPGVAEPAVRWAVVEAASLASGDDEVGDA